MLPPATRAASGFDHSHAQFDAVLKARVNAQNLVDYATLKRERTGLDAYLATAGSVSQAQFKAWTRDQQLAFLINVYNAATLQLIIDAYPLDSIRDIGFLPGAAWRKDFIRLFGGTVDLDHVEHGIIRKDYREPRIHFALVCAARSCPPLRREAYVADRLDAQLDDQARTFLRDSSKNAFDLTTRTARLSSIFDWYGGDFGPDSAAILTYLKPFLDDNTRPALDPQRFKIEFLEYDWKLNEAK